LELKAAIIWERRKLMAFMSAASSLFSSGLGALPHDVKINIELSASKSKNLLSNILLPSHELLSDRSGNASISASRQKQFASFQILKQGHSITQVAVVDALWLNGGQNNAD
jgi:hypothetical protein